jgi:ADP-heptose:LPS heptosyltransferase
VVARRLAEELDQQIVFTGTEPERSLVEGIQAAMQDAAGRTIPSYSLVGRLDIGELAALITLAPCVISNNSGPVHIAAAIGTPVVVLYALTNPQHTPWQVPNRVLFHDVPCKYCYQSTCPLGHHDCLRLVSPASVVEAVRSLLAEVRAAGSVPERRPTAAEVVP